MSLKLIRTLYKSDFKSLGLVKIPHDDLITIVHNLYPYIHNKIQIGNQNLVNISNIQPIIYCTLNNEKSRIYIVKLEIESLNQPKKFCHLRFTSLEDKIFDIEIDLDQSETSPLFDF